MNLYKHSSTLVPNLMAGLGEDDLTIVMGGLEIHLMGSTPYFLIVLVYLNKMPRSDTFRFYFGGGTFFSVIAYVP